MKNENDTWWRKYPCPGCSHTLPRASPLPHEKPVFQPGERVRIKDKPERLRLVIHVVWHTYCHEFVYVVETSTSQKRTYEPSTLVPYWFDTQLVSEEQWKSEQTSGEPGF